MNASPAIPRVVWESDDRRVVVNGTAESPRVHVEDCQQDAMGVLSWRAILDDEEREGTLAQALIEVTAKADQRPEPQPDPDPEPQPDPEPAAKSEPTGVVAQVLAKAEPEPQAEARPVPDAKRAPIDDDCPW